MKPLLSVMEKRINELEAQNRELLRAIGGVVQLAGGEVVLAKDFAEKLKGTKLETSVNEDGNIVVKIVTEDRN